MSHAMLTANIAGAAYAHIKALDLYKALDHLQLSIWTMNNI